MFRLFSLSYSTEKELNKHEKVYKNPDYCYVEMSNEDNKILKRNHGEKSMKVPFIIYADVEPLLEKMSTGHNNPKNSSTTKINKYAPSGYSLLTHCSFDLTKNELDCYKDKKCTDKFCKDLRQHAIRIISYEKKEMIPLTDKENKFYKQQKVSYICNKEFSTDDDDNKKYQKVRDHCHYRGKFRGAAQYL